MHHLPATLRVAPPLLHGPPKPGKTPIMAARCRCHRLQPLVKKKFRFVHHFYKAKSDFSQPNHGCALRAAAAAWSEPQPAPAGGAAANPIMLAANKQIIAVCCALRASAAALSVQPQPAGGELGRKPL